VAKAALTPAEAARLSDRLQTLLALPGNAKWVTHVVEREQGCVNRPDAPVLSSSINWSSLIGRAYTQRQ
jgi:hypothetical protein